MKYLFGWAAASAPIRSMGKDESGQSLVLLSFSLIIFIAMMGLVLDIGYGVARQRQMQVAADAAALSGAYDLAQRRADSVAIARMQQSLSVNGAQLSISTSTVISSSVTDVWARSVITPLFASLLGMEPFPVSAHARAAAGQVGGAINLMPFVVQESQWVPGQTVELWAGGSGGAGNSGWVAWQGYTKNDLPTLISQPYRSGSIRVGDRVPAVTGVSFNPLVTSLNAIIGQVVTIILYNPNETQGTGSGLTYRVRGFAHFRITGVISAGSNSRIRGTFILQNDAAVEFGGNVQPGVTIGVQGVGLLQ